MQSAAIWNDTKHGIRAPAVEPLVDSEVKYLTRCYHIDGFCVVLVRSTLTKASWSVRRRVPDAKVPRTAQKNHSGVREVRLQRKPRENQDIIKHFLLHIQTCYDLRPAWVLSNPVLDLPNAACVSIFRPALVKRTVYSEGPWTATSWRGGWTSAAQTVDFPWLSDSPSSAPMALRHEQRRTLPVQRHREVQQQHQEQMA